MIGFYLFFIDNVAKLITTHKYYSRNNLKKLASHLGKKKKKTELDPSLFLYTKLNSRGINNLNVKINTIKQ